jgi:DNA-binding LytR/AlgR family response regulator
MKTLRVLIVEDEPIVAMDLETIVTETVAAAVVIKASVAGAKKVLDGPVDFAFLDVDVTNGKTFEVAQILGRKHVPFVFVSSSSQEHLPVDLRSAPFIAKPFDRAQIVRALKIGAKHPGPAPVMSSQGHDRVRVDSESISSIG